MRPPLIHKNLAAARERAGVTQRLLAQAMDMHAGELSRAESGRRHIRAAELWLAAQFLGIDIAELYAVDPKADAQAA